MSSFTFQKTSMSSVIYAFKRRQCLHLHFKDFNVFSHLCFQKTEMSSFTFQKTSMSSVIYAFKRQQCLHLHFKRLQCLQSFTLPKDDNVFIYISKTSMSLFIYAFKRRQYLHLHFKRLQCLQSFTLSKDYNVFIYISKTSTSFVFYRTQCPCLCFIGLDVLYFYALKKKRLQMSSTLQNFNVLMFSQFHFLGFSQLPGRIARSLERN
ncbi:hypothetical protein HKD37_10G028730 [Glycine soja]